MGTAIFGAPEWKARSGRTVKVAEDGSIAFHLGNGYLGVDVAFDAEEFYQAKRDDDFGRWRWPKNPDYVVYAPVGYSHYVRVLDERSAILEVIHREHLEGRGSLMAQAARAYFEAHPERMPWRDAKPGEGWAVTIGGEERLATVQDSYFWIGSEAYSVDDGEITGARKVWPEDAS